MRGIQRDQVCLQGLCLLAARASSAILEFHLYHRVSNFLGIELKYSHFTRGRYFHTAWTPPTPFNSIVIFGGTDGGGDNDAAELTAEVVQSEGDLDYDQHGDHSKMIFTSHYFTGSYTFDLTHSGYLSCGIPDGETYVLTGGGKHNFVTRSMAFSDLS